MRGGVRRYWPVVIVALQLSAPALQSQVFAAHPNPLAVGTRVGNAAINGVIGSVTGLVWASIRHSPKWAGVKKGAAGGVLMSVGKQISATAFDGSGFLGREVSAVGVSLAVSVGKPYTTYTFPIGPMSLEYGEGSWDWCLNATQFVALIGIASSPHTRFDLHQSLSSGTPVFRDDRFVFGTVGELGLLTGFTQLGTIQLARRAFDPSTGKANVIYHEHVHILQDDYFEEAIALPTERAAIERLPFGRRFLRHLDLGALGPGLEHGLSRLIPYESRPWEREAYGLTANLLY